MSACAPRQRDRHEIISPGRCVGVVVGRIHRRHADHTLAFGTLLLTQAVDIRGEGIDGGVVEVHLGGAVHAEGVAGFGVLLYGYAGDDDGLDALDRAVTLDPFIVGEIGSAFAADAALLVAFMAEACVKGGVAKGDEFGGRG